MGASSRCLARAWHSVSCPVVFIGAAVLVAACGDDGPPDPTTPSIGPAAGLAFLPEPADATAGETLSPTVRVEIRDADGDRVDATNEVTVSLSTNPGDATLTGTLTVSAVEGVATFSDLSLTTAATGYRLRAASGSLQEAESEAFAITPAAPAALVFTTAPSDAEGQEPISPAVQVAVRDEFGNTVTTSTANVSLALSTDPTDGEVTVAGTLTVSAAGGVAAFPDLSLDLPASGYALEATASGLPPVTSAAFAVHLTFVQTSAGNDHTCGVTTAGKAYCWGWNGSGQLGDGTTTERLGPVAVRGGLTFVQVTAGQAHSCALTPASEAYCWGANTFGRLGSGTADASTPVPVQGGLSFAQINAGGGHTCGVTTADEAYCWGFNLYGQVGDGSITNRGSPTAVSTTESFVQVSAGGEHTCAVTAGGDAYCWGLNDRGRLGHGTAAQHQTPVAVEGGLSFAQVDAGAGHTCGVTTADEAYCWGENVSGMVGDGTTLDRFTPAAVEGGRSFSRVGAGDFHTCGVTTVDEVYCWGRNDVGQLGEGMTSLFSQVPVPVSGGLAPTQVSTGGSHTCVTTPADGTYCWGSNDRGQLGDGTTADRSTPVRVVQ